MTKHQREPAESQAICLTENGVQDFDRSRFWGKVDRSRGTDGCWLWTGAKARNGYGMFKLAGKVRTAHRLSLCMATSQLGEVAQHSCDNRACVNPAHLSWSTQAENMRDARSKGRAHARSTHCKRGHEFTDDNTVTNAAGHRTCRTCRNASAAKAQRRRRATPRMFGCICPVGAEQTCQGPMCPRRAIGAAT